MTTAVEIERKPDLRTFQEHWQDESDASYLYGILAQLEPDQKRANVFGKLRDIEVEHARIWADLLASHGQPPGTFRPSTRARIMAMLGRRFGPSSLVSLLLREEGREVREYLTMHRETAPQTAGRAEALQLAKESAEHATELAHLAGVTEEGEPWHRVESGGFLRNVVYGFTATQQHEAVVVAGVAGVIADALSMGSSGYLAAKSELEVHAHEIAMERDEIAYMPELERDELALIYETKGMDPAHARALADEALKDPERMLQEKVQAELGIGTPTSSPMREAWITGVATAVGALLPVFPFFVLRGTPAIVTAFMVAMAMHFLVGAARSVFTGRGLVRSGIDMFVVGLGVAVVGYFAGDWVAGMLG
jgi:VIT1/CCC1 family predicted Fe2+/Mn2+ transporter